MVRPILGFILLSLGVWSAKAEPPPMPMPWLELTHFYYTPIQVRQFIDNPVYFGTNIANNGGWGPQQKSVWNTVDLRPFGVGYAPPCSAPVSSCTWVGVKMAQLSCDLIITGYPPSSDGIARQAPITADLTLTFRAHGDTNAIITKYLGQTIEAHTGGGQRSNFSTIVPTDENGMFDYAFNFPDNIPAWDGTSTGGAAFGANCTVQMWAR